MPDFYSYRDFSLNGTWQLCHYSYKDIDKAHIFKNEEALSCTVPGDVHKALIEGGKIADPFLGDNVGTCTHTEDYIWCYKKCFDMGQIDSNIKYTLEFESVDVNCTVYFNNALVGCNQNAFTPIICDITPYIKEGNNTVVVVVDNGFYTICKDKEIDKYDHKVWIGYENDFKRIYLRKPQFCFKWDWAQRLVTCGIAGNVTLRQYKKAKITCLDIKSEIKENHATLAVGFEAEAQASLNYRISVSDKNTAVVKRGRLAEIAKDGCYSKNFVIYDPKLWWPNGLGNPHLYSIVIELIYNDEVVAKATHNYGIRKIGLIEEPINEKEGKSFTITVNDVPIFCKGANWVPAEALCGTVTKERYRELIKEAKAANFNILRVWGGGRYENNEFYKACDEAGILVWQDFIFANAYYPDDVPEFMENIQKEFIYQLKRLRNYSSVAVWCGNNEINWSHPELIDRVNRFYGECIYDSVLPLLIKELDGSRIYRKSSPYGGSSENSTDGGDSHSWFFWLPVDEEKAIDYKQFDNDLSKFSSEYGVLSHPPLKSIKEYTQKDKLSYDDKTFLLHNNLQELGRINKILLKYYCENIPTDMNQYVLMSQYMQGSIYRYIIEHYRRRKPICSGSMFWMYNDCWGVTSWTIIDYYLRRKASYYMVKNAYAPILVSAKVIEDALEVYVVNDTLNQYKNAVLSIAIKDFGGKKITGEKVIIDIEENCSNKIRNVYLDSIPKNNVFAVLLLESENGEILYHNTLLLSDYKELQLKKANIDCKLLYIDNGIQMELESDYYASCVFVEDDTDGDVSDNYFSLIPFEKKTIYIKTKARPNDINITCLNQNNIKKEVIEYEEKAI